MHKQILLVSILLSFKLTHTTTDQQRILGGAAQVGVPGRTAALDRSERGLDVGLNRLVRSVRSVSLCKACAGFIRELNEQLVFNLFDERGLKELRRSRR